jgi:2-haloacid dehalogenase
VGLVKPDPQIFALMLAEIKKHLPEIQPSELVFIDDNLKNAQAATSLGWHGVHYTGAMETETKLRELGIKI